MSKDHHLTVDFRLTDGQYARLERLVNRWNTKHGAHETPESLLNMIFRERSIPLINRRLSRWERGLDR